MLNLIWGIMIVGSIIYMIATGNGAQVAVTITNSAGKAVELCLSLSGIYCFWMGIMNIVQECGAMRWMARLAEPVLRKFFPDANLLTLQAISTNISANILGLGNAATPSGLKAMELMASDQKEKGEASDSMILFLVMNTSSLQIIPTTIISLRSTMGDAAAGRMLVPVLITTSCSTIVGIIACKLFSKFSKKRRTSKVINTKLY